jgi:hypothetical protein
MPRDRFGASNIGTFACRSFPRDTKASKRANFCDHGKSGQLRTAIIMKNVNVNFAYIVIETAQKSLINRNFMIRKISMCISLLFLMGGQIFSQTKLDNSIDNELKRLVSVYKSLHTAPELSGQEQNTSSYLAAQYTICVKVNGYG